VLGTGPEVLRWGEAAYATLLPLLPARRSFSRLLIRILKTEKAGGTEILVFIYDFGAAC
jgi:hypothetical protein